MSNKTNWDWEKELSQHFLLLLLYQLAWFNSTTVLSGLFFMTQIVPDPPNETIVWFFRTVSSRLIFLAFYFFWYSQIYHIPYPILLKL